MSPSRARAIAANLENLLAILASMENVDDTGFLDDLLTDEWSEDRDEYNSIWSLIREKSIMQLMRYEKACCSDNEDYVPYTNYIVIFERDFMEEYFRTILTPSGMIVKSARANGETWA